MDKVRVVDMVTCDVAMVTSLSCTIDTLCSVTLPPYLSREAKDILKKLLKRHPPNRLGSGETDAAKLKVSIIWKLC